MATDAPLLLHHFAMVARVDRLDALHGALERFWAAVEDRHPAPVAEIRMRFDLAVAEIVANICEHAYASHEVHLDVELVLWPGKVSATLEDDAEPAVIPRASGLPPDSAESGRGLEIARWAVESVVYERAASGRNRWSLSHRLD